MLKDNIRKLRKQYGYSQVDLGNKLGISDKTISSWEIGRTEPNMGEIQDMAKIFNCSLSEIIDGVKQADSLPTSLSHDETEILTTNQ